MGHGDRLASGEQSSALFAPAVTYNLKHALTDEEGAFPCQCGQVYRTAAAFCDHLRDGTCTPKEELKPTTGLTDERLRFIVGQVIDAAGFNAKPKYDSDFAVKTLRNLLATHE